MLPNKLGSKMPVMSPCLCSQLMRILSLLPFPFFSYVLAMKIFVKHIQNISSHSHSARTRGRSRDIHQLCWVLRRFQETTTSSESMPVPQIKIEGFGLWRFLSNMTQIDPEGPGSGIRKSFMSIGGRYLL
ncbi:hypothetical protein M426DRAFT_188082 [Hypoxylon sp. CI-4A]|nr:hypothetical protein M426DRAFT_188082 [Hypoxylon sp. CI-4A]